METCLLPLSTLVLFELLRDFGDLEEYKVICLDSCLRATSALLSSCCFTFLCHVGTHKNLNKNLKDLGIFKAKKPAQERAEVRCLVTLRTSLTRSLHFVPTTGMSTLLDA